jgi:hypothetical protein
MTTKTAFSEDEWTVVAEAPTSAGMIVLTASHGGTFRETVAVSKAYTEARTQHGKSELLDEIVGSKPKLDRTHYHSTEELKSNGLQHVRDAISLLENKATEQEVEDYRQFVLTLANRVAAAHSEHGEKVSPQETEAIHDIEAALGAPTP